MSQPQPEPEVTWDVEYNYAGTGWDVSVHDAHHSSLEMARERRDFLRELASIDGWGTEYRVVQVTRTVVLDETGAEGASSTPKEAGGH